MGKTRNHLNVFDSAEDFLNLDKQQPTPLIRLGDLNPFPRSDKVHIFLKAEYLRPTLNLKLGPAWNMLQKAKREGKLNGVHTLVEGSSGNLVFALAIAAPYFGIKRVIAIVPADIAPEKRLILDMLKVKVDLSTEVPGKPNAIENARRMGKRKGYLNLGQYENEANPEAHEKWTAAQCWEQTDGDITVFCAGMGTVGTAVGAKHYFAKRSANVATVGVMCAPENAVPGVRPRTRLQPHFDWKDGMHLVEAETKESYQWSLRLLRAGFMAGPSSGFALAGLITFLKEAKRHPLTWEKLRNKRGEIVAVCICGDTPFLYLNKYSTILDPQHFETTV